MNEETAAGSCLNMLVVIAVGLAVMACLNGCVIKIPITLEFPPRSVVDYMFPDDKHK